MKRTELKSLIREVLAENKKKIEEAKAPAGLTKAFDETVVAYQDLMKQKQDLIKGFVKSKDKSEKAKSTYMKDLKALNSKIEKAESKFNRAVDNLPDPEDDDLI